MKIYALISKEIEEGYIRERDILFFSFDKINMKDKITSLYNSLFDVNDVIITKHNDVYVEWIEEKTKRTKVVYICEYLPDFFLENKFDKYYTI